MGEILAIIGAFCILGFALGIAGACGALPIIALLWILEKLP